MLFHQVKPRQSLNKAFLKVKPTRPEIEVFKTNLIQLIDQTNDTESEEHHKNLVADFLKKTYYDPDHYINTKERNDLVIHNGKDTKSSVGVIIEAKKPTNKAEMLRKNNLNVKAFHELVLYYLRERITGKNLEVKYLIGTNIHEWFVFDAQIFEKTFAQDKSLVKQYEEFVAGHLSGTSTDFFYREIVASFIDRLDTTIEFAHFDLRDFSPLLRGVGGVSDNKLIALFKLLSPQHLLKLPFANDSNSLDRKFYSELLHIIGLTETKQGGKKVIERNKPGERNYGSLLENAIIQLDTLDKISRMEKPGQYGATAEERLFNVGLELSITWVNRILFLKLLEAQLIAYHKGDSSFSFLNYKKIRNYDDLNSLFFQVLAKKHGERSEDVQQEFGKVPYLNSSLFEPNEMEHSAIFISNLRDEKKLPILSTTVLKDQNGKKRSGELNALQYFFEFLEAYDFSSEGAEDIQEDNKTLINASVLGLIFEKINGYKDGSFFTPGFITMYMCRETIRRAVVQKFNDAYKSLLEEDKGGVKEAGGESGKNAPGGVSSQNAPLLRGAGGVSLTKARTRRTIIPYNPKLKEIARKLRNDSTKAEIALWKVLKGKFEGKYDFHRQKPLGNYIADFYCYELKLVIEVDGISHDWEETQQKDFEKESRFVELGLNVLRYSDEEVLDHTNSVLNDLRDYVSGFEKRDLSTFVYEDTPLNPLSRGDFALADPIDEVHDKALFHSLDDIYDKIGNSHDDGCLFTRQEANDIVNSLKICDPAVGSGHFLVSALNEIIAIKHDLKILQDRSGKRLKEYRFEVVNDELVVTDEDGELFEYHAPNINKPLTPLKRGNPTRNPVSRGDLQHEVQRVQETLFMEKQTIIENCLFGVDINPNSVKICRLRLWIELLKNAYYKFTPDVSQEGHSDASQGGIGFGSSQAKHTPSPSQEGSAPAGRFDLETLPNIDINIKCGNSLISRFSLDADIKEALKKSQWNVETYRSAVDSYRNAQSKEEKREMQRLIDSIKGDFRSEIARNDPKLKKLSKIHGELLKLTTQTSLFDQSAKEKKAWNQKVEKLTKDSQKLEAEIEEIKNNQIYENAFEWRFEFPEVLNDDGDFVGFDVVIGNPPYIRQEEIKVFKPYLQNNFSTFAGTADLFVYFIELGMRMLKHNGNFTFIVPNKWMRAGYGKALRNHVKSFNINSILDFGDLPVFEEATTYPCILSLAKQQISKTFLAANIDTLQFQQGLKEYVNQNQLEVISSELSESGWSLSDAKVQKLLAKLKQKGKPLGEYVDGKIFYGIKTGFNEAFVIDEETKEKLIAEDPKSAEIIKPFLAGRDIKRYQQPKSDKYLILFKSGATKTWFGDLSEEEAWFKLCEKFPSICQFLKHFETKAKARYDKGNYWWELRACDYYEEFESVKIMLPDISNKCEALIDEGNNFYCVNTAYIIPGLRKSDLGILNSKLVLFFYSNLTQTIRGGYYRFIRQYLQEIPFLDSSELESKVTQILDLKKADPNADTSALEAEIDQLVYALYGLTEEEIKIVEGV